MDELLELSTNLKQKIQVFLSDPAIQEDKYTRLRRQLQSIQLIAENNYELANRKFSQLPVSKYETFSSYVYNTDATTMIKMRGATERSKTLRTRRNNHTCPLCGAQLTVSGSESKCNSCGWMSDLKDNSNVKPGANNAKHINKQLDIITGVRQPPANIKKIADQVEIWLTDLKYIYAWLVSKGRDHYDKFTKKVMELLNIQITGQWFNRVIPRDEKYVWKYPVFKLFMDEFYGMLEYTKRLSDEKESNMAELPDELVYFIAQYWLKTQCRYPEINDVVEIPNKVIDQLIAKLPEVTRRPSLLSLRENISAADMLIARTNEVINVNDKSNAPVTNNPTTGDLINVTYKTDDEYKSKIYVNRLANSTRYEIGRYLNSLSLWAKVPEDNLKHKLEQLFRRPITIPGLMFNYAEVYKKADSVPKKYAYQQEFCWLTNRTFHVPFVDITTQDKTVIADLIHKFNMYYKDRMLKETGKTCNSPLYCCTIECILSLPYFEKYKSILDRVPVKDRGTAAHIQAIFHDFARANPDILRPYNCKDLILPEEPEAQEVPEDPKPARTRRIRRTRKQPRVEVVEVDEPTVEEPVEEVAEQSLDQDDNLDSTPSPEEKYQESDESPEDPYDHSDHSDDQFDHSFDDRFDDQSDNQSDDGQSYYQEDLLF